MTENHDGNDVRAGRHVNWVNRILVISLVVGAAGFLALYVL